MTTREIIPTAWKRFCERVQEHCQGAMVSIELQEPDGTTVTLIQDLPLRGIALDDQSDPCNTHLVFVAGSAQPVRHVAIEPFHIRLKDQGQGERYHRLQVVAENGTTTAVFHPGLSPELLQGLEIR